jgi:hypothetical protein
MELHGLLPPLAPFFTQERFRGIRGKLLKDLVKKARIYKIAFQSTQKIRRDPAKPRIPARTALEIAWGWYNNGRPVRVSRRAEVRDGQEGIRRL